MSNKEILPKKSTVLIILDGWGYREKSDSNAIQAANTPVLDKLKINYPNMLIHTSGMAVGLPDGQMGNSEVGHVNLGAGRVVYQDFTRITKAIEDGEFTKNLALCQAVDKAVNQDKAVHIFGLLSPGGVHSHEDHIFSMMELAKERGATKVYLPTLWFQVLGNINITMHYRLLKQHTIVMKMMNLLVRARL